MYSPVKLGLKYLRYFISASNGYGHGTHSPFVFDFITKVLTDKKKYPAYGTIEELRRELLQDKTLLTIEDLGAGSRTNRQKQRTIAKIAKSSLKPIKFGQLLFRMIHYYQPKNIIELGTSLGVTTCYLATGNKEARVKTLEGSRAVASVARENFNKLQLKNVELIEGNFDDILLGAITDQRSPISFSFVDGNHRKEPTIAYFNELINHSCESSILIFDDIHWSKGMEEAWEEIKQHSSVTLTIDLFFIGIVFLRMENKLKQHFVIRF